MKKRRRELEWHSYLSAIELEDCCLQTSRGNHHARMNFDQICLRATPTWSFRFLPSWAQERWHQQHLASCASQTTTKHNRSWSRHMAENSVAKEQAQTQSEEADSQSLQDNTSSEHTGIHWPKERWEIEKELDSPTDPNRFTAVNPKSNVDIESSVTSLVNLLLIPSTLELSACFFCLK